MTADTTPSARQAEAPAPEAGATIAVPMSLWLDWERLISYVGDGKFDEPTTLPGSVITRIVSSMNAAALSAHGQGAGAVPREPTPEMFEAGDIHDLMLPTMAYDRLGMIWQAMWDAAPRPEPAPARDGLVAYLQRQWAWSKETFGPALRTKGVVQHIRKELVEIESQPHDLAEWVDVIILAMDGFWRHGGHPESLLTAMQAKQDKNFARTWPDWRTMGEDQAIEHDRTGEASAPARDGASAVVPGISIEAVRGLNTLEEAMHEMLVSDGDREQIRSVVRGIVNAAFARDTAPAAPGGDGVEAALDAFGAAVQAYADRLRHDTADDDRAEEAGYLGSIKDARGDVLDAVRALQATPADVAGLLDDFDQAAQTHGWESDQGSGDTPYEARMEWIAARSRLNTAIAALVRRAAGAAAGVAGDPSRWRHVKRGTTYRMLGKAEVQVTEPYRIHEEDIVVVYQSEADGKIWVRPEGEFEDGRFARIEAAYRLASGDDGREGE